MAVWSSLNISNIFSDQAGHNETFIFLVSQGDSFSAFSAILSHELPHAGLAIAVKTAYQMARASLTWGKWLAHLCRWRSRLVALSHEALLLFSINENLLRPSVIKGCQWKNERKNKKSSVFSINFTELCFEAMRLCGCTSRLAISLRFSACPNSLPPGYPSLNQVLRAGLRKRLFFSKLDLSPEICFFPPRNVRWQE